MSRAPVKPAKEPVTVAERLMRVEVSQTNWLVTMQQQDGELKRIMNVLSGAEKSDDEKQLRTDYELRNHRLFRKVDGKR